jgi:hypothetical protein
MYRKIADVILKTGEHAEMGVVLGPDEAPDLRRLLGHKGAVWTWQIEQSLNHKFQNAESRFYILSKAGRPFANVMTVESRGVGIFGHVFTAPEERRKGAADIIHAHQMADFKQRGGRALYLGTGFDTPPFKLYERHGFRGVEPGSGYMTWFADSQDAFERDVFAPSSVRHEAFSFEHWPTLPALAMMAHPARVRIAGMDVINIRSTEGGSLPYLVAMDSRISDPENKTAGAKAWLAISEKSNMPVAIAAIIPEHYFWTQALLLDLFCAPGFEAELPKLFEKLQVPAGRNVICYADTFWPQKQAALQACGFKRESLLKKHLKSHDQVHDVELWAHCG